MKVAGSLRAKRGIWQMVFTYQNAEGIRKQHSESTHLPERGNKRKAQELLEQRKKEIERQYTATLEVQNTPFLVFMRSWLDDVVAQRVKETTVRQYNYVYNGYIAKYKPFHGVKLQDLTPAMLQSYYNAQLKAGLSPNTIRKHHANIHKCLSYAVRLQLLPANPANMVELPPKRKYTGATAFAPEQLKTLLEAVEGDPLEVVVKLTATYGLRRSEVCGLRWCDIDFEKNTIHICHTAVIGEGKVVYADSTKTITSNRVLPLTGTIKAYLQTVQVAQATYKELLGEGYTDTGYVCVQKNGTPVRPDYITSHFKNVLEKADLPPIRFHDLRHSAVYTLRQGGCDVKDIQCWLGHSDVSTTLNVYGHLLDKDMTRLGQVMDTTLFPTAATT